MSLSPKFSSLKDQTGAAAVEFAIIASILFMLVFGIIEFGRIFNELEVMNSAAREGARAAAVRGTFSDIETATANAASPYTLDSTPTANIVCNDDTSGDPVTVSWGQQFEISTGLLPEFNQTIQVEGTFRCE
jgi:Flp pilus assembly protein TadG